MHQIRYVCALCDLRTLKSEFCLPDLEATSVADERFTSWNVMTSLLVNALTSLSQSQSLDTTRYAICDIYVRSDADS